MTKRDIRAIVTALADELEARGLVSITRGCWSWRPLIDPPHIAALREADTALAEALRGFLVEEHRRALAAEARVERLR